MASEIERNLRPSYSELASHLEALVQHAPAELDANDEARIRLLEAANKAIVELETPGEATQRVIYTPFEIMGAKVAMDLDLFNILTRSKAPLTTNALAEATGAEEFLLTRLLKFLASMSMIKETAVGLWSPSRLTHTLAIPTIAAGISHSTDNLGAAILALPNSLRRHGYQTPSDITDTAFTDAHPEASHIFEWFENNPKNMQNFNLWMDAHRLRSRGWLDIFPFQNLVPNGRDTDETPTFVDVAGGIGYQCRALLQRFPGLKGRVILEDHSQVLAVAPPIPNVDFLPVDIFEEQPIQGARVYYMRSVLHSWPDAKCQVILSRIRAAMQADSMILIDELVVPEVGAHKTVMQMDMTMLLAVGAEERTEQRWRQLVESVGLYVDHIYPYDEREGDSVLVVRLKE